MSLHDESLLYMPNKKANAYKLDFSCLDYKCQSKLVRFTSEHFHRFLRSREPFYNMKISITKSLFHHQAKCALYSHSFHLSTPLVERVVERLPDFLLYVEVLKIIYLLYQCFQLSSIKTQSCTHSRFLLFIDRNR